VAEGDAEVSSPSARAASTYCISRIDSTLDRTTRAARGMIGTEIAITTLVIDCPSAADITIASTRSGSPWRMSSTRCVTRSSRPPGVAGQEADHAAQRGAEQVDATPTISETRAPCTMRENMSRPMLSVPSQCAAPGRANVRPRRR
jgi:hypothetical protein